MDAGGKVVNIYIYIYLKPKKENNIRAVLIIYLIEAFKMRL